MIEWSTYVIYSLGDIVTNRRIVLIKSKSKRFGLKKQFQKCIRTELYKCVAVK